MRGERVKGSILAARQSTPRFPSYFKYAERPKRRAERLSDRLGLALLLGGLMIATASLWSPHGGARRQGGRAKGAIGAAARKP